MSGLHPIDRELLYFICSCAHHRVRVVRIKAQRVAALRRLRYAGLVSLEGFQPSQSVFADWLERHQTPVPRDSEGPAEPPAPEAVAEGGGAARCVAPPPTCKAKKSHPARPTAAAEPHGRHRADEREAGSGPISPVAQPRLIAKRDPTQPPPGYYDQRPGAIDLTDAVIRRAQAEGSPKRKSILKEAAARNAAGLSNGDQSVSVHVRMAQRALADQQEQEFRRTDPVEQAKLKLARRHSPVCGAEIMGGPEGKFYVGRKLVSKTELLAMAARFAA